MMNRIGFMSRCLIALLAGLCSTQLPVQDQPPQQFLLTNVMVFDGTSAQLRDVDVLVTDNVISQVSDEPLAVIASTSMN